MAVRVIETNLLLVVTEAVKPDCEVCRELVPPEELIQEGKESKFTSTAELQWLKHLWAHESMFERG